jgi:tetratricopeptide (TPR) repeat protein
MAQRAARGCRRYLPGVIAQNSRFVDAHRLLAEILSGSGRIEAALDACRRVADLVPTDAPIWQRMGSLLLSLSRPEGALAAFDHAISRDPSFARAHAGRGLTLIGFGRDVEAVEALTRAVHWILRAPPPCCSRRDIKCSSLDERKRPLRRSPD